MADRTYRERREARAERLREWADKREAKASAASEQASAMAGMIPFGQPILVGHHSEGRDRRYRDRIGSKFDQAHEHGAKAASMRSRADNIDDAAEHAIYSDDTDAVERLRERIATLEAERERIKAYNASCRKGTPDLSLLTEAERRHHARTLEVAGWQCKGGAFPSYHLSNLSGNIKRQRDRLAQLLGRVPDHGAGCDGPLNCVCP